MAPELHQRVRQLFDEAMERPEAERNAFVENAAAGDANLLKAVERLLRARSASESFLEPTLLDTGRIGRYLIRGELGRGAMGIVYDAVDPMIGRRVAVKVISLKAGTDATQAEFMRERLFREARSAGRLFHPGIVVIFDVGLHGDSAFITMERVEGQTLQQLLASGGALDPRVALSILKQTAAALDYAHQLGVVHRDIKPANIMLHDDVTVKVTDFGIAKLMSTQNATVTGLLMGTPSYMSPEQIEARLVDGQSDQFSLAVLAYELLTGVRPFEAEAMPTLAHLIVYGPRPSAHAANSALPKELDRVLERALSRSPGGRFSRCTEFTATLEKVLQKNGVATQKMPDARRPQALDAVGRRIARPILYCSAVAVLIIVALVLASGNYKTAERVTAKSVLPVTRLPGPRLEPPTSVPPKPVTDTASATIKPKSLPAADRAQRLYETAIEKRDQGKFQEAVALFRQAADLGNTNAMKDLAESYSTGEGVAKDGLEAERWLVRAAAGDNSAAMVSLGALYLFGDAIPQSFEEAARWFQRAADRKNPDAMYNLGGLYESGDGVPRDVEKAMQLYRESANLGNGDAKRRLAELGAQK